VTLLAIPWFVLTATGSAARTGVAAACETVPLVVASALGGPLIDRIGARRAAVGSDVLSAVGISVIPLLHLTVGLQFWQLCLVVGVTALVRAPGDTARTVLVPALVEVAGTPVERATSAYDGVSRAARMIGAPLAGVLIAVLGPAQVLLVDAATFLASAALLQLAVPVNARAVAHDGARYLQQLREGVAGLRADRLVLAIVAMVMVTNLLDAAWAGVLMPVYAREVLHSSVGLGLLFGSFGVGALTGSVLSAAFGPRMPRWPVYTVAFLVVGAPRFGLLALQPPLPVLLTGTALLGIATGFLNPILSAVEYERIPVHLQSRVLSVSAAGVLAGVPVGAVLGGFAVERAGLTATLLGTGGLYLLATLTPLVFRVWREMDATRDGAAREHRAQAVLEVSSASSSPSPP
jgi:predicted MFS family arabinose efflux permease